MPYFANSSESEVWKSFYTTNEEQMIKRPSKYDSIIQILLMRNVCQRERRITSGRTDVVGTKRVSFKCFRK